MKKQPKERRAHERVPVLETDISGDARQAREQAKPEAAQTVEAVKQRGQEALHAVKDHAQELAEEARDTTHQAVTQVTTKAQGVLEQRKVEAASRARTLQQALQQASTTLRDENEPQVAEYASLAATRLARVQDYLEQRSIGDLTRDAEAFTRRHPEIVFGGLLVAGLATARFLKSTSPRNPELGPMADSPRYRAPSPMDPAMPSRMPAPHRA